MPSSLEENTEGPVGTKATSIFSRRFYCAVRRLLSTILFYRTPRIVLGIVLLIIGLAGLALPILPGVVTIVGALAILRKDTPFVARLWERFVVPLRQRYRHWREVRRSR